MEKVIPAWLLKTAPQPLSSRHRLPTTSLLFQSFDLAIGVRNVRTELLLNRLLKLLLSRVCKRKEIVLNNWQQWWQRLAKRSKNRIRENLQCIQPCSEGVAVRMQSFHCFQDFLLSLFHVRAPWRWLCRNFHRSPGKREHPSQEVRKWLTQPTH